MYFLDGEKNPYSVAKPLCKLTNPKNAEET